ncbi:RHS repeat-associated core domain-containing protein [Streptomyces mutabilis]|uniref:RHS repeat-associated core domain-containing protein n=1 Tax=Streptomyces mutabilis TaxID=67332 RepID=UPI0034DEB73F
MYADPTGLYKRGHRYCDPSLGRFTQPDPSGQEENAHLYAGGDPISNTDPTGFGSLRGL